MGYGPFIYSNLWENQHFLRGWETWIFITMEWTIFFRGMLDRWSILSSVVWGRTPDFLSAVRNLRNLENCQAHSKNDWNYLLENCQSHSRNLGNLLEIVRHIQETPEICWRIVRPITQETPEICWRIVRHFQENYYTHSCNSGNKGAGTFSGTLSATARVSLLFSSIFLGPYFRKQTNFSPGLNLD